MKTKLLLALLLTAVTPALLYAQGSLTPPGGPIGPTMKSLDEVEARTPVNTLPSDATATHIITLPGSYYLTGPIDGNTGKVGIRIEAVNVTLDLNGFTLDAVSGSTSGITANAPGGPVVIRNGVLRFWTNGVVISGGADFILQDLQVVSTQSTGVQIDGHGTVERVSVQNAKSYGIDASATSRVSIRNCRVDGLTNPQAGIDAPTGDIRGCLVANIISSGSTCRGIYATSGSVDACVIQSFSGSGDMIGIQARSVSRCAVSGLASTTGNTYGVRDADTVTDTQVSSLTSGSTVAYGIHNSGRIVNCDVSSITGGSVLNIAMEQCVQVVDSKTRDSASGIRLKANGLAARNLVNTTGSVGISASHDCVVLENSVSSTVVGNTGILSVGADRVRVEGNHVTGYATGINTWSTAVVIRNTAGNNTTNYSIGAGMVIVTPAAMGTNPFANVSQ